MKPRLKQDRQYREWINLTTARAAARELYGDDYQSTRLDCPECGEGDAMVFDRFENLYMVFICMDCEGIELR